MQVKRNLSYVVVGIVGILLINLIASNDLPMENVAQRLEWTEYIERYALGILYCFLLGVLLEWKTVVRLIKKDVKLCFSARLIPGLLLLVISCIPPILVLMCFGINLPFPEGRTLLSFFIGPLSQSSGIQKLLAVVAGSMIIKSLSKKAPAIRERLP